MKESLFAAFIFWGAFMFLAGPWRIAFMEAAKDASPFFAGGAFILYLAHKTLPAKIGRGKKTRFDRKAIPLLGRRNPKARLSVPAGSLAANRAGAAAINIPAFFALSISFCFFAVRVRAAAGREE